MFSHLFFQDSPYCIGITQFTCPLMRLMAVMCIADDYSGDGVPYWCFRQIDEIVEAMGLHDIKLESELNRACLASLLEPVYEPFFHYMTAELDYAFVRGRNGRCSAPLYWYSLHRFLCDDSSEEEASSTPFQHFTRKVERFIELHRADQAQFSRYRREGELIFFEKHGAAATATKDGTLYQPTNPRYAKKFMHSNWPYW